MPYFRDEIVIDQNLSKLIGDEASVLPPGSPLLIAGRNCKHDPDYAFRVPPGYNLILLVDQYDAAADGSMPAACRHPVRAQQAPRVRSLRPRTTEGQEAKAVPALPGTMVETSPCFRSTSLVRIS